MVSVKFFLEAGAIIPELKTSGAAAYDVYNPELFLLKPGRNAVPLNFRMSFSKHIQALIEARSGFSLKGFEVKYDPSDEETIRIDADVIVGKIDSDFRGIVNVIVKNNTNGYYFIPAGERIAQLTFIPIVHPDFECVDSLDTTERGDGGFGHTGTK